MSSSAADVDDRKQAVPIVDLSLLHRSRSLVVDQIRQACRQMGFFQIINHGIDKSITEGVLDVNSRFFDIPLAMKEELMSDDVNRPVRFATICGEDQSRGQFSRDFLKLTAYPFEDFVTLWPRKPSNYREKMRIFSIAMKNLSIQIFGAMMESLNLDATYKKSDFEQGEHIIGVNSYPPCSQSNLTMGIPPHTDHTIITILLQSCHGLYLVDGPTGEWKAVPEIDGSLQVLVGDHLEVLSNGLYRSVLHYAIPSLGEKRLSIASFHGFGIDETVEPAKELVDEEHPKGYKGSSFRDYLKHLSSKEKVPFIKTLKI